MTRKWVTAMPTQTKKLTTQEYARKKMREWQSDPVLFSRDLCEFDADPWQEEVLHAIADPTVKRISIKSGQGVGKTAMIACAALYFLTRYKDARIVATAPTMRQLQDVLWPEISKWMSRGPILSSMLTWTKTYVTVKGHEQRWFAVARTATKPENMQGFHEDNMLFLVDEASGIAEPIMEAILGTLSGGNNKLLLTGNPTRTSGTFYDSHTKDRSLYKCFTVSSEDSPRTSKENIESLIRKYGRESNVVRVRVLGEFPTQEDDVFIPLSLIEQCSSKLYDLPTNMESPFIVLGCDVARFGDDETVIYRNYRGHCRPVCKRHGQNLMATVGDIVKQYRTVYEEHPDYYGKVYVQIDDTGLGGGVTDRLREVKKEQKLWKMEIIPINAAEKIEDDSPENRKDAEHYNNLTTAMWACLRDHLEHKTIVIEDDDQTVAQLSTRKYMMASNGKIEIEAKKKMKERGLDSPDRGDALALCLYLGKIRKHTGKAPTQDMLQGLAQANYWG